MSALLALAPQWQTIVEDEIRWEMKPFTPRETPTLRVQTFLVQVPVVVRDAHGRTVGSLTQRDFEVLANGKPQAITSFAVERAPVRVQTAGGASPAPAAKKPGTAEPGVPPPPRYVALLFDDLNLPMSDLVPVQKAAEKFVRKGIQAGDREGIFTTSGSVTLEPTSDTAKVLAAIGEVKSHKKEAILSGSCPHMGIYQAHLIYNRSDPAAIALAVQDGTVQGCLRGMPGPFAEETVRFAAQSALTLVEQFSQATIEHISEFIRYLGRFPGRKTLVLTSSGFFTMTLGAQQDKLMNAALKAKVVINSLDAKGLVAETPGSDVDAGGDMMLRQGRFGGSGGASSAIPGDVQAYADSLARMQREIMSDPLSALAQGTGGRFFHDNNDFGRGMRELTSAPEDSYILGFMPAEMTPDGKFHDLKVRLLSKRGYTVEARKGYFAPTKEELAQQAAPGDRLDRLNRAVSAVDQVTEISGEVSTQQDASASGGPVLNVTLHVEVKDLPFVKRNDRSENRLVFVTALFGTDGRFVVGAETTVDLSLKDATRAMLAERGLDAKSSVQAPRGTYRLRVVIQELGAGRLAAVSLPVEIK